MIPTAGSIGSSFRSRPAPIMFDAAPMPSASIDVT
jgi:hypothetical protein